MYRSLVGNVETERPVRRFGTTGGSLDTTPRLWISFKKVVVMVGSLGNSYSYPGRSQKSDPRNRRVRGWGVWETVPTHHPQESLPDSDLDGSSFGSVHRSFSQTSTWTGPRSGRSSSYSDRHDRLTPPSRPSSSISLRYIRVQLLVGLVRTGTDRSRTVTASETSLDLQSALGIAPFRY